MFRQHPGMLELRACIHAQPVSAIRWAFRRAAATGKVDQQIVLFRHRVRELIQGGHDVVFGGVTQQRDGEAVATDQYPLDLLCVPDRRAQVVHKQVILVRNDQRVITPQIRFFLRARHFEDRRRRFEYRHRGREL